MIILVDLEHERLRSDTPLWRYFAARTLETKYRLEKICGDHCLVLDYRRATPAAIREIAPKAVVAGGNYTGFQHFSEKELDGFKEFLVQNHVPTLTICGSHQLLVQANGGHVGPMASENPGAGDHVPDTDTPLPDELLPPEKGPIQPEGTMERGYLPVRITAAHPLFSGISKEPVFYQLHGGEVKRLPGFFSVLAESEFCKIQAVAHKHAPVFGVQFHPELFDDTHQDGKRLLENFFSIAGM